MANRTLGPISKKKTLGTIVSKAPKVIKSIAKRVAAPRAKYVRQPAKMTNAQWKKMQAGMDEKWPQPEYMNDGNHEGRAHTCYRDETYMMITRWTSETQIRYRPHAKAPGSKSHTRYEKYSKARTVKEALKLGSWPADWCWDYERGFIKVVGGRLRDEPIDSSEAEVKNLDEVDQIVARWFIREAARMLGLTLQELRDNSEARDELLLRMKRTIAEARAKDILSARAVSGAKLTEDDVLSVLQKWGFRKNITRLNVAPEGASFVFSDTMGLVADRKGNIMPTRYTLAYPNVSKVLCDYLHDHLPESIGKFTFTSINVNKNYAGRRHRDGNNVGPSVIKAFGKFTGGLLEYFPNDNRKMQLEDLPESDKVKLDLAKNMALFDGRRAHQVQPFKGERFSLVWFTCPRNDRAGAKERAGMQACGFALPTAKDTKHCLSILTPPSGYDDQAAGKAKGKKAHEQKFMTWVPKTALKRKQR